MESVCIFADSRGENQKKSFRIKVVSLLEKVEKFLDGNDHSNNKIIYIFAGVNDLTPDREHIPMRNKLPMKK